MTETQGRSSIRSLIIGVPQDLQAQIASTLKDISVLAEAYSLDKLMEPPLDGIDVILCGLPPPDIALNEVGQLLRSNYQSLPIFLILSTKDRIERKVAMKNGFTDAFFLPLDVSVIGRKIDEIRGSKSPDAKVYRSVKLLDLTENSTLDFDTYVYLPANNKHLRYSSANSVIDAKKIEKLKARNMTSVFVNQAEMQKFYQYTAKTLRNLGSQGAMSETERTEKMHNSIRELVSGLFTDTTTSTESGKKIIEDCKQIVRSYVTADKGDSWYDRVLSATANGTDTYSHAGNTSTYASLFTVALGLKTVEDVALAGLLHDIGLSMVPTEIQNKPETQWTPEERAIYEKHPEFSIEMIRDRKLVVSDLVHKIILQHHMNVGGTGFPKSGGGKVCLEAQILALADRFDDLTAIQSGKPRKSPVEAIHQIRDEGISDPSKMIIDTASMKKIVELFPTSDEKNKYLR